MPSSTSKQEWRNLLAGIPGEGKTFDIMAPNFQLKIAVEHGDEGVILEGDITQNVISVSYEHTLSMASKLALRVENTWNKFSDTTVFQPGNEVELWLGYGSDLEFIGRAEIVRHLPSFPQDAAPTLDIVAYSRSHRLMKAATEIKGGKTKKPKKPKGKKKEPGRVWSGTIESIVTEVAGRYGMIPVISSTKADEEEAFIQKKGTSDYIMLSNLARAHGLECWVEYDYVWRPEIDEMVMKHGATGTEKWALNFYNPQYIKVPGYDLTYGKEDSVILSMDLEFGTPEAPTEIQAWIFDRGTGGWVDLGDTAPEPGSVTAADAIKNWAPTSASEVDHYLEDDQGMLIFDDKSMTITDVAEVDDMVALRLALGGHAIDIVTLPFRDLKHAKAWVKAWFNQRKNDLITVKGEMIGVETVRAGQRHSIHGVGAAYSGEYYFTSVTHKFDATNGYRTSFSAHKVMKGLDET